MKLPTVKQVERAIGQRASKWKGNCFGIARAMVTAKLVEGAAVYGFYHGPIAKTSMFAGRAFTHHGWVLGPDGLIIDPTRWVFEDVEPYIFTVAADTKLAEDYDEGGNRLHQMFMKPPPGPNDKEMGIGGPQFLLVSQRCNELITVLLTNGRRPDGRLTKAQLFWLANLPYEMLGEFVHEIYRGLKHLNLLGFVPIDNQHRAQREEKKA